MFASEELLYVTDHGLTVRAHAMLAAARAYFVGHQEAVGALFIEHGVQYPMFLKSGYEGGPWGGTQRGSVPRGRGWGFTSGGPSQGNIATHVEGHASAVMWQRTAGYAVLIVDRPMCSVCHRSLHATLPPNSTLVVYSDEEGRTIVRASHAR